MPTRQAMRLLPRDAKMRRRRRSQDDERLDGSRWSKEGLNNGL